MFSISSFFVDRTLGKRSGLLVCFLRPNTTRLQAVFALVATRLGLHALTRSIKRGWWEWQHPRLCFVVLLSPVFLPGNTKLYRNDRSRVGA